MTVGTHPFIPSASKLGSVPICQRCPNEASHAVHDWLSAITPEEMVQLPNLLTGYENRDDCDCVSRACSHGDCEDCPDTMANCCDCSCHYTSGRAAHEQENFNGRG